MKDKENVNFRLENVQIECPDDVMVQRIWEYEGQVFYLTGTILVRECSTNLRKGRISLRNHRINLRNDPISLKDDRIKMRRD